MQVNFEKCLGLTLKYEGGFSLIRTDPGNWTGGRVGNGALKGTQMGIASSTHPNLDIRNLTHDDVAKIYKDEYWQTAGCDALPAGIDLCVFDAAVNSGVGAARRWLARANMGTPIERIHAFCAARLSMLNGLRTWRYFGKGWGARVANVEAAAVRMALGTDPRAPVIMLAKADVARGKIIAQKQRLSGVGASAGVSAVGAQVTNYAGAIVFAVVAVAAIAGVVFFIKQRQQAARVVAFEKAAMEPAP